jgi:hypothetical protein
MRNAECRHGEAAQVWAVDRGDEGAMVVNWRVLSFVNVQQTAVRQALAGRNGRL